MKKLGPAIRQLPLWQKMVIGAFLVVIFLTWMAVCLVLASSFAA